MEKIKVAPVKPTISYKEFEKVDIRVGTIESVDPIEKADKLVKLSVNFGNHRRQIIVDQKCHPDFEAEIGSPGMVRMLKNL